MSEIRIDDPKLVKQVQIDDEGRVYLGRDWAGKQIRLVVEDMGESECQDSDSGSG